MKCPGPYDTLQVRIEKDMKGRYSGRHMTTYGYILPRASKISRLVNLSKRGKQKLKVLDWHHNHGDNQSLTSRHFGVNRETLRDWINRVAIKGLAGLNDKSHRPKRLRKSAVALTIQAEIIRIRKENPYYSKYKIASLLSIKLHPSTVGRILKRKGLISQKISRKRVVAATHPKKRFPRDILITKPGALVQVDTKHLNASNGHKLYQFTAIDVLTKLRVLSVSTSISSKAAADFLKLVTDSLPFKINALQTDNGSEFHKYFDDSCTKLKITHYYSEPRSPKQNSYVERSHLTDDLEFYRQGNMRDLIQNLLPLIKAWEYKYNHKRPHQSLNYLTPMQYFEKHRKQNNVILQT
jgi:transposase InsO family protein